jgi:hypothetical protein
LLILTGGEVDGMTAVVFLTFSLVPILVIDGSPVCFLLEFSCLMFLPSDLKAKGGAIDSVVEAANTAPLAIIIVGVRVLLFLLLAFASRSLLSLLLSRYLTFS